MTAPTAPWQAQKLRDAALLITTCAQLRRPIQRADGQPLCALTLAFAKPVAATLLAAAEHIERAGTSLGLPVSNALEIAGLVLDLDLGHNRDHHPGGTA